MNKIQQNERIGEDMKALIMLGGEFHPFDSCGKILEDFLKKTKICEPVLTDDRNRFKDLKDYDLVIVYTQGGELTSAQEESLCGFVRKGGGLIGIHCASDSWVKNKAYLEMLGSHFIGHGPVTEFLVRISHSEHDITRRISNFKVIDEFYILEEKTSDFEVLAEGIWQFKTHPLAYIRNYGKGKVFYTALGHDERAFKNPFFQKFIFRAGRWTTNQKERRKVRCGVVGYGGAFSMGKCHADSISKTPGLSLTAICEIDKKRLEIASKNHPEVKTYAEIKKMLSAEIIDLGVVVTPHNTHSKIALSLIDAGKNVICEKPFAITVKECTTMIEAAKEKGIMLSVFHNRRWDGDFLSIKRVIDDGLIGEIFHIEAYIGNYAHPGYWWRSEKPISGGIIYDWGAHFVDWILNLMPGKMETVYGIFHKRLWYDVTSEDQGGAIIRFEAGRYAEFQISTIAAIDKPKWRILGTKGALTINQNEDEVNVVTFVNGYREELKTSFMESCYDNYYINIADHLLTGEALSVTAESARRVIAVLELAEKSARTGKIQPVPYEN